MYNCMFRSSGKSQNPQGRVVPSNPAEADMGGRASVPSTPPDTGGKSQGLCREDSTVSVRTRAIRVIRGPD